MNLQQQLIYCQQHQQLLQLTHFDHEIAWQLGEKIKRQAETQGVALAIDITVNHQSLFSYAMPGTSAENHDWLRRKRNVVELLNTSSYAAGLMLQHRQTSLEARYGVSLRDYAALGGGFPLQVKHAGIIGSVNVSGAPHLDDHNLLLQVLADFIGLPAGSIELLSPLSE
ncbi:heme-degrading domain-containing protein [Yersinia massiliensis]|uniref:heme-degrading domain-containing protein n=1 Tax=Yersinia massiliensis TaxID=419257 RepID=UPI0011A8C81A|nr:heme-degrading domain-containing protein [Yersinia massiliensis]